MTFRRFGGGWDSLRAAPAAPGGIMVEAEDSVGICGLYVVKQKRVCKRHRLYSLGPNLRTVRSDCVSPGATGA